MSTLIQPAPISRVVQEFKRAGSRFDAAAAVFETVGDRLRDRLDVLLVEPEKVLDLGCRSGYQLEALQQRYPRAHIVGLDPAPGALPAMPGSWPAWLRTKRNRSPSRVAGDPHILPFADAQFELVVSNLLLPWCQSPHKVFEEVARVLKPGGAFLFTSAGPDTLKEYRAAWATIDAHLHVFGLVDMHDLGDAMLAAGFSAPVLDRDNLNVDYPSIEALQNELRDLGAANLASGRRAGLMSPEVRNALKVAVGEKSRFQVSLELVQGHGWKGDLPQPPRNRDGTYAVSLESLRDSIRK